VNAEQWNAKYPVGTLVFAYPGFRPEDASDARRLVTKTRTAAQVSASGDPVVWVEGEGSYICLTHVDPVAQDVWEKAQAAEVVAAPAALPVPVGDPPQPLDDELAVQVLSDAGAMCGVCGDEPGDRNCEDCERVRRGYIADLRASGWRPATALAATVQRLKAELGEVAAEVARFGIYGSAVSATKALVKRAGELVDEKAMLRDRVAELESERHTTNEALSRADEQAHADRDRIAELEQQLAERSANPIAFRVLDGLVTVAAYTTAGQARQHAEFLARREHRGPEAQELLWRADLDEPDGTEWLTEVTAPGYSRPTGFGVTALPLLDLFTETAKEATS
jgi:hypothetical protein